MPLEFITETEFAALPEDSQEAFVAFVRIADDRLEDELRRCKHNDDRDGMEDARYAYHNAVLAAARRFHIDPLNTRSLPESNTYTYDTYRRFRADVEHSIMQIGLTRFDRQRSDPVPPGVPATDALRAHIPQLRSAIDSDEKLTEAKRDRLYALLDDFEKELARERIRLGTLAPIADQRGGEGRQSVGDASRMERPAHLTIEERGFSPRRIAAISGALALEAAAIYVVATALTFSDFRFLPQSLDVEFLGTNPPEVRPVMLPRLELVKPPIPTVAEPDIPIQTRRPPSPITAKKMRLGEVMLPSVQIARAEPSAPPAPSKPRGITAPVSIGVSHSCEHAYPSTAVRLDQQGTTIIRFTVNTDGSVSDVHVVKPSGHEMLDDAAIRCATFWRYRPALANGQPVPARWTTNIQWKLQNGSRSM